MAKVHNQHPLLDHSCASAFVEKFLGEFLLSDGGKRFSTRECRRIAKFLNESWWAFDKTLAGRLWPMATLEKGNRWMAAAKDFLEHDRDANLPWQTPLRELAELLICLRLTGHGPPR